MSEESGEEKEPLAERIGHTLGVLLVIPTLLILFAAAIYAIGDAVFSDSPAPADPDVFDSILGSDAVVAAVRIAIIFAATYVVVSVVALVSRRQWLNRVGPVQVTQEVSGLVAENTMLRDALESAGETIQDLQDELRDTTDLLNRVVDNLPDADEEDE